MTLAEFLLARITEDELVARLAAETEKSAWWMMMPPGETPDVDAAIGTWAHIVRHDPGRVLAECEAKRRIVERHQDRLAKAHIQTLDQSVKSMHETLRDLASVYADHPDYRDEWRP